MLHCAQQILTHLGNTSTDPKLEHTIGETRMPPDSMHTSTAKIHPCKINKISPETKILNTTSNLEIHSVHCSQPYKSNF